MRDTRRHSYRLLLLASVATVAIAGSAHAANYNNSTPVTNAGPSYTLGGGDALTNSSSITSTGAGQAAVLAGSGVSAITNSGVIQGTGANGLGIQVVSGGSVGSITNSGTVQAANGGNAIVVGDTVGPGASVGSLVNTGLLQASGTQSAVEIYAGSTIASIVNSAAGTIQASYGNGIDVQGTAGSVSNAGSIGSTWGAAINVGGSVGSISNSGALDSIFADALTVGGSVGTVANSGSITGGIGGTAAAIAVTGSIGTLTNAGGIQAFQGDAISLAGTIGGIANSGSIVSDQGDAINVTGSGGAASLGTIANSGMIQSLGTGGAITVGSSASIGAILNSAGGVIAADGSSAAIGIGVAGGPAAVGTISNSGTILANAAGEAAIDVGASGSLTALDNSAGALIRGGGTNGVAVSLAGTIGSIVNSGTIGAPAGTAMTIASTGSVVNGITNTASGLIGGYGGTAIDDSAGTNKLTIDTAGTIVGGITLGPAGDTLNVTGGTIAGAIIGQAGSGDALNFSPAGTFATGGAIANVDSIDVVSGTVAVQQPVSGAQSFDISPAAAVILNSSVGASSFYNAGLVSVGTGSETIAGNYTQASSGALGITVTTSHVGALTVTGDATFQGTLAVAAHVATSVNVFALTGTNAVLTANTIIATGGSLVASSDNSAISFGLTDTGTQLLLSPLPMSYSQIQTGAANDIATIFAPISGIVNGNEYQGQQFLKQVFVGLASTGRTGVLNNVDNILTGLTPSQLLRFNDQLLPSTLQGMDFNLLTELNVLSGSEDHIDQREEMARLEAEQTGLAAGDQVGRGITFWGQPFGAVTNQGQAGGFDGYDAATYGITLGGDELVMPNLRVGAALSLSNSNVNYNGTLSGNNGNVFTGALDLYGIWYRDNFFVDGLFSFGYNHYSQHNQISALGVTLDADSGGTEISGKIGAGYDYHLGNGAILIPYASLQQYHFNFGGYTTTGGSAYGVDMHVNGTSADMTQTRMGAKLDYPVKLKSGILTPNIHLYWLHDFGADNLTQTYTTSDLPGSNQFYMVGPSAGRDTINVGVGVSFAKGNGWALSGGYDYAGRSSLTGNNFYLELKVKF